MAGVSQHDLNNPWIIESNVDMIIVTGLWVGGGWAGWKFFGGRRLRAEYEGRGPDSPKTHAKQGNSFKKNQKEILQKLKPSMLDHS